MSFLDDCRKALRIKETPKEHLDRLIRKGFINHKGEVTTLLGGPGKLYDPKFLISDLAIQRIEKPVYDAAHQLYFNLRKLVDVRIPRTYNVGNAMAFEWKEEDGKFVELIVDDLDVLVEFDGKRCEFSLTDDIPSDLIEYLKEMYGEPVERIFNH